MTKIDPSRPKRKRMTWRRALAASVLGLALVVGVLWYNAWAVLGWIQESRDADAEIVLTHLGGTVYLIEATREGERPFGYVSALASVGADGALLVDPMVSIALAAKIEALLEQRGSPVRFIVNTHAHPDHTRGNAAFDESVEILAHRRAALEMASSLKPFPLLPATRPLPARGLPDVTFADRHTVELNGERITLRHFGPAHTAGDTFVFFEKAGVVHVGDTFLGRGGRAVAAPISGGSFEGLHRALGELVAVAPPDALVVGGHGGLGGVWKVADVEQYRELLRRALDWVAAERAEGEPSDEDFAAADLAGWREWSDEGPEPLLRAIWNAGD